MSPEPSSGPLAVLGDDGGAVTELVESVGFKAVATEDSEAAAIVAVGADPVLKLARESSSMPVLPVAVPGELDAVPADALQAALEDLSSGRYRIEDRPVLAIRTESERLGTALIDVMVVTDEPAHISEYSVATPETHLSTFRADGVVLATPAGSGMYARRVGGAVMGQAVSALSVVPVAAFKTEPDHWVVDLPEGGPALQVTVERDDTPVVLSIDDRQAQHLAAEVPVTIERSGTLRMLTVAESVSESGTPGDRRPVQPGSTSDAAILEQSDRLFPDL